MNHNLVPVVIQRRFRSKSKPRTYMASVALLANEDGKVFSAGVGFQGKDTYGRVESNSKKIGLSVALGRAIKAATENINNSEFVASPQAEKVNEELGIALFDGHKGVLIDDEQTHLPENIKKLVDEAIKQKTRVVVNVETGKWHLSE